jgi:hypothetical protein
MPSENSPANRPESRKTRKRIVAVLPHGNNFTVRGEQTETASAYMNFPAEVGIALDWQRVCAAPMLEV